MAMGSEQYSLSWSEFHSNLSQGFVDLLYDSQLVDVTLSVEGRQIEAHKVVLSVISPYFREIFASNPCKHPIVFLRDISFSVMTNLLKFIYQGEVNVRQNELAEFIKTAEDLQIKGLTNNTTNRTNTKTRDYSAPSSPRNHTPRVNVNRPKAQANSAQFAGNIYANQTPRAPLARNLPALMQPNGTKRSFSKANMTAVNNNNVSKKKFYESPTSITASPSNETNSIDTTKSESDKKDTRADALETNDESSSMEQDVEADAAEPPATDGNDDKITDENDTSASTSTGLELTTPKTEPGQNSQVSQDEIYFIKSLRGSPMLVVGYYTFSRNKRTKTRTYWLCCKAETSKCKVSCIIEDDGAIRMPRGHIHNHPNEMEKIMASEVMHVTLDDISKLFVPSNDGNNSIQQSDYRLMQEDVKFNLNDYRAMMLEAAGEGGKFAGNPTMAEIENDDDIFFYKTSKGSTRLMFCGYTFNMKSNFNQTTYWICSQLRTKGCRVSCNTKNGQLFMRGGQAHTHPPIEHQKHATNGAVSHSVNGSTKNDKRVNVMEFTSGSGFEESDMEEL